MQQIIRTFVILLVIHQIQSGNAMKTNNKTRFDWIRSVYGKITNPRKHEYGENENKFHIYFDKSIGIHSHNNRKNYNTDVA